MADFFFLTYSVRVKNLFYYELIKKKIYIVRIIYHLRQKHFVFFTKKISTFFTSQKKSRSRFRSRKILKKKSRSRSTFRPWKSKFFELCHILNWMDSCKTVTTRHNKLTHSLLTFNLNQIKSKIKKKSNKNQNSTE